jgi:hypothetical protein
LCISISIIKTEKKKKGTKGTKPQSPTTRVFIVHSKVSWGKPQRVMQGAKGAPETEIQHRGRLLGPDSFEGRPFVKICYMEIRGGRKEEVLGEIWTI